MEGDVNRKEGAKVSKDGQSAGATNSDPGSSESNQDTYDPWLQVSYRRNGRNIVGSHLGGKKLWSMAGMGKIGSDSRHGNGLHSHGTEISRKVMEISNREVSRKKQVHFTANKYRGALVTSKNHLIRPFKENLAGEQEWTIRKGNIKSKQVSAEIEKDLEDSNVLKILHKDMLDSVVNITNSLSPGIDGCNSILGEGKIISDVVSNGLGGTPSPLMVDVASAKDLDVVASNMHEAMKVALE
ncbi:hypothetical protein LWI29_024539 [Acer saccharum]|uniref:Uncharacterized protein n=1 Tax=Acer saccharum TaxID=4024 RepID=A0AA39SWF7_ACESA|nr:hypothetical protein LWI29_024539 [Acer saccharum]